MSTRQRSVSADRRSRGGAVTETSSARDGAHDAGRRAALMASLAAGVHRVLPSATALVVKRRSGAKTWSVLEVISAGGHRVQDPGTRRAVERAVIHRLLLLAPWLPEVKRVTLDLADPDRLEPEVVTAVRTPAQMRGTPPYRVLTTSKHRGVEIHRYLDGRGRTGGGFRGRLAGARR